MSSFAKHFIIGSNIYILCVLVTTKVIHVVIVLIPLNFVSQGPMTISYEQNHAIKNGCLLKKIIVNVFVFKFSKDNIYHKNHKLSETE